MFIASTDSTISFHYGIIPVYKGVNLAEMSSSHDSWTSSFAEDCGVHFLLTTGAFGLPDAARRDTSQRPALSQ